MDWKENYCICQRWGVKFECGDNCFEIDCEVLSLGESFQVTYFGNVLKKVYQYATTNEKVCKNLRFVSIKST